MKSSTKLSLFAALCITTCHTVSAEDVLVIGSSQPFATELGVTPPDEKEIVARVKQALVNDLDIQDGLNVAFEDIYRTAVLDTAYGGGGKMHAMEYRCHSLAQWFFWPEDRQQRLANLQGKGATEWDYIVLVGDAYLIAEMPGIYAEGVYLVADAIRGGNAQPLLFLPWSDSDATSRMMEVVCRVGMSAGLNVLPMSESKSAMGRLDGPFESQNPFAMKVVSRRKITYNHTGTSSERGIERAIKAATARCGVEAHRTNGKRDGETIDFNYGRGNSNFEKPKQYKVNPDLFGRSYGFPMQDHSRSAAVTMLYGIDRRFFAGRSPEDGTDLGIAWDMIRQKEVAQDVRCIPIRLMWAKLHDLDPALSPLGDRWHMNRFLHDASATFLYTLLSGRCPMDDMPEKSDAGAWGSWLGQKVGYETAWRMSHLSSRAPGLAVRPLDSHVSLKPKDSARLSIKLHYQPTQIVRVRIITDNPHAATAKPEYLTFTPDNHGTAQTVTVTAGRVGEAAAFSVKVVTTSKDAVFNGLRDLWAYSVQAPSTEE